MHNEQCTSNHYFVTLVVKVRTRRRRRRRRRWWWWRRSSCFRHLSFQMEMSTRHAFLYHAYGVVCVWIWHVIGQLCFDPSKRARGASPPNRAWALGSGCTYMCSAWSSGRGGGGAGATCAFLTRSMATDPHALARLGGASTTRMRLLNGGWGIFSRWPHSLTYPGRFWKRPG